MAAATWLVIAGGLIGLVLGGVAAATDFCTFGGIIDWVRRGDRRRARSWVLAAAVALVISQSLDAVGLISLGDAFQRSAGWSWLGGLLGGSLFGWGMTLTGGCGLRLLVRLGGGSQRALIGVLALAVLAYATQRGLLAPIRLWLESLSLDWRDLGVAGQGLPDLLWAAGLPAWAARAIPTGGVAAGLLFWSLFDKAFRALPRLVWSGVAVGVLISAGWAATAFWGADPFDPQPLRSLSYVAPLGASLVYVMTSTGSSLDFTVATVLGTVVGATLVFRRRGYAEAASTTPDVWRHLAGGGLMGVGGVLAGGCTIGQGLSGLSTLSLGAVVATASIIAASVLKIRKERTQTCA